MRTVSQLAFAFAFTFALAACRDTAAGGGPGHGGAGGGDAAGEEGAGAAGDPSMVDDGGARGLTRYLHASCSDGGSTTISGTVYDPANVNPVYNATVYVPQDVIDNVRTAYIPGTPLRPLPNGIACGSCSDLFYPPRLGGRHRRYGSLLDPGRAERREGPAPRPSRQMADALHDLERQRVPGQPAARPLAAPAEESCRGRPPEHCGLDGAADSLECLLLRMGVDPGEYVGGAGGAGRVHIFSGDLDGRSGAVTGAGSPDPGTALWDSAKDLDAFDLVLLSCEGGETANMNQQVLLDYANGGGRVFASHFHYAWFDTGPFATISGPALATWTMGAQPLGNINAQVVTSLPNGRAFPEGVALGKWLGAVGALGVNGAPSGELPILSAFSNAAVTATNVFSQPWIVGDPSSPATEVTEYFSFDTPANVAPVERCGRVVYSDLHASGGDGTGMTRGSLPADYAGNVRVCPDQCAAGALTPQEKALEFMIFNLSSCLAPAGEIAGPLGLPPTSLPPPPQGS